MFWSRRSMSGKAFSRIVLRRGLPRYALSGSEAKNSRHNSTGRFFLGKHFTDKRGALFPVEEACVPLRSVC
jgi:hypothetical protein